MFKFYCLNPIASVGLDKLGKNFQRTEDPKEAQAFLVRSAVMHDMELSDNLLAVGRAGAGVNNIPLDKCAEKGIVVFNTPGANANGVKELVIAGMLMASRDIVGGVNWINQNSQLEDLAKLAEKQKKQYAGFELKGKTLGVIGLGAIGALVANTAVHFGMEVLGYDPYISVDSAWNLSRSIKHIQNVEDIYSRCDYITIHVPLLDSTKGMIGEDAISLMKDGVIVLNFARDLLVNEEEMIAALNSGKVRKYVSDFPNGVTAGAKGCIVLPHLGASTKESEDNCAVMAAKEIKDYLENGNIRNSVNFPNCDMGKAVKPGRIGIMHRNVARMIGRFTSTLGNLNVNICELSNKSRNGYAYSLMDLEEPVTKQMVEELQAIDGVLRVRVIK